MAVYDIGTGPDTLTLRFFQDAAGGEPARVNFGVLPNGAYDGNDGEYLPITATSAGEADVFNIRADIPKDSAFFFSFVNDFFDFNSGADRNVHLVSAEINGQPIAGSAIDAYTQGDFGPVWFDGDAQGAPPPPPPVPGQTIRGTNAAETLAGGAGPDTIAGLNGNDTINGLGGADSVSGGAGSDTIDGGPGNDVLTGNGGNDLFLHSVADGGADTIADFAAGDRLALRGADGFHLAAATQGGASGTLVTFDGHDGSVFLAGAAPATLEQGLFIA